MRKILTVILVAYLVIGGIAFIKTLVYPTPKNAEEEVATEPEEEYLPERDIRAEEDSQEIAMEDEPEVLDVSENSMEKTPVDTEEEEAVNIDPEPSVSETEQTEETEEASEEIEDINEDVELSEEARNGDGRKVTVNTEKVNLRREPSTRGKIIIVVREGETGVLIEDDNEGWSKAEFDGISGYISSRCIDVE